MERVRVRAEHLKLAAPGEPAITFAVRVTASDSESTARVEFLDTNSEKVARTVRGGSCPEVVAAIALVTAMAIEARVARNEPSPPTEPSTPSMPSPQLMGSAPPRESPAPTVLPGVPPDGPGWGLGGTGAIVAQSGLNSGVFLGLYGERMGRAPFRALRATVGRAHADASLNGRDADFVWWTASFTLCPWGLRVAQGMEFLACAGGEGGLLTGEGQPSVALPHPLTSTITWGAALSSLRMRWTLEHFVVLEASGEVGLPLVPHKFRFDDPREYVFEIPAVRFEAALAAGFRF